MKEAIGFLSVKRHEIHGYLGGLLVLNFHARPLEFHCTLPVSPSRAQQLLYGPTIHDFICGEQIAKALIAKSKLEPSFILTDCEAALAVCLVHSTQIAYLRSERDGDAADTDGLAKELELPKSSSQLTSVEVGPHQLLRLANSSFAEEEFAELLSRLAPSFDLQEPFGRITDALLEAHPMAKAA